MKANELRIGNYLTDTKNILIVKSLTKENVYCDIYKFKETPLSKIETIPLTEDWLLKFGFTWDLKKVYLCRNEIAYRIRYVRNSLILIQGKQCITIPNLKHVHQLQNLYFTLIGNELILTQ